MKINGLHIRTVSVPLAAPHRTAMGVVDACPLVLVRVMTDAGVVGNGIIFTYTASALKPVADFINNLESLLRGYPVAPSAIWHLLHYKFRLLGTQGLVGMAIAGIDMALWDASAKQHAVPLAMESKPLLSLATFIGHASKGMPITVARSPLNAQDLDAGQRLYEQRIGQLNLSCAQCHSERAGLKLAGNLIPEAHPTGYPIYRLEWQTVGSLQRRLRNCMTGVRAEPYALGSKELTQLELFLMWRARGMPLETPGVRP
jgi:sulfur oxidation c-type cytochrome SoxA